MEYYSCLTKEVNINIVRLKMLLIFRILIVCDKNLQLLSLSAISIHFFRLSIQPAFFPPRTYHHARVLHHLHQETDRSGQTFFFYLCAPASTSCFNLVSLFSVCFHFMWLRIESISSIISLVFSLLQCRCLSHNNSKRKDECHFQVG